MSESQPGSDVTPPPIPLGNPLPEPATHFQDVSVGTRIDQYRLLQKLGEGGMGEVWLAEQIQPVRRQVAIKLIRPGMASRQFLARFEAERQALAILDHPNIAKVLDAGATQGEPGGVSPGRPYFVMELVKGIPITRYCDHAKLSTRERLELFVPICQAVQHAHQKGIIHRDLKPSNILVGLYDGKPVPKIIDFGVAKAAGQRLTEQTLHTEIGAIIGTPEYMAPEQAELNNLDIDTRSDIYSLGVVLYELLTGSLPFNRSELKHAGFNEILRLIREVEPPKPSTRLSSSEALPSLAAARNIEPRRLTSMVRGDLDWIVMKCLEKERTRRYETANGLALDIERFLAEEPVLAGPPSVSYRMRKFVRRNRGAVIAASLLMFALVAGMIGTTWAMQRAVAERDRAERALDQAEQQRRNAESVLSFLENDLLRQADPWRQAHAIREAGGQADDAKANPTIVEVLDRAAAELAPGKIEQKLPDQPLVHAQLLRTIGETYRAIGEHQNAIEHLRRAAELEKRYSGAEVSALNGTLLALARSLMDAGRNADALRLLEHIHDVVSKSYGPRHRAALETRAAMATAQMNLDRRTDALKLLGEVLELQRTEVGPRHADTLSTMYNLAVLNGQLSRHDEAIRLFETVRNDRLATLGPDHPDMLTSLFGLAGAYSNADRSADALRVYEQLVPLAQRKLGADHPYTLRAQVDMAQTLISAVRIEEATALLEKTVAAAEAKLGPAHRTTLDAKNRLARRYHGARRLPEAIRMYEQVCERQMATLGADHTDTIDTRINLGSGYRDAGRLPEAIAVLESTAATSEAKHGPNDHGTITAKQNLATTLKAAGRIAEAIRLYEQAVAASKTALGPGHGYTWDRTMLLATCYLDAGRFAEAEPLLRDLLRSFEAKKFQAFVVWRCQAMLGQALLEQKKLAEAEPFLLRGFQGMKQRQTVLSPADRTNRLVPPAESLIKLYDQLGKADEAAKWRRELADITAPTASQSP